MIKEKTTQIHPLQLALKVSWQKLIVNKEIKQYVLADQCHTDESRVSRWVNPHSDDFPPTHKMAQLIEAMQTWPGVERWEPIEAFNRYFRCHVADMHHTSQSVSDLTGLIAATAGKLVMQVMQAQSPDSEGGVDVAAGERERLQPISALLRRLADDLDDAISGGNENDAAVNQ